MSARGRRRRRGASPARTPRPGAAALAAKEHDLTKYQWHERRCLNCRGEPERCVHIPPAPGTGRRGETVGVPPVPQGHVHGVRGADADPAGRVGVPTQHPCHVAAPSARITRFEPTAPGATPPPAAAVLLRCVSCQKAFCDQCSGGAEFEAVETTPSGEWEQEQLLPPGAVVRIRDVPAVRDQADEHGLRGRYARGRQTETTIGARGRQCL